MKQGKVIKNHNQGLSLIPRAKKSLAKVVATGRKPIDDLVMQLLRIDSVTTTPEDLEAGRIKEKEISDFLMAYCQELGFDYVHQDRFANVIAALHGGRENRKKVIGFNGHIDTKPPGDLKLRREGDWVYGRGASDMKGAIASMLDSAADLIEGGLGGEGTVVYMFVAYEETGILEIRRRGTPMALKHLKERDLLPNAFIIGESSQFAPSEYRVCDGERGRHTMAVSITGQSAHGAFGSELGVNAHVAAGRVLGALFSLDKQGDLGSDANINVGLGDIADTSYNVVPNSCPILIDMRYPDRDALTRMKQLVLGAIEGALGEEVERAGRARYEVIEESALGEPVINVDKTFLDLVSRAYAEVTGRRPPVGKSKFGTDGRIIRAESPEVPILIAGPGLQRVAHTPHERVSLDQLRTYSRIYSSITRSYISGSR